MLVDIHCHQISSQAHIQVINRENIDVHPLLPNQYQSIGIHPWNIQNADSLNSDIEKLKSCLHKNILFIGECGLDKAINTSLEIQQAYFEKQIELAKSSHVKAMIIHSVRAYQEVIRVCESLKFDKPLILHDYNASPEQTLWLLSKNCYFSYGKKLFLPETKGFRSLKLIPVDKIFFETDDSNLKIDECYHKYVNLNSNVDFNELEAKIFNNFQKIIT